MGLFDFFKKKENNTTGKRKITKEEVDKLLLITLDKLCDGVSTEDDVKKFIMSKGLDESEAEIFVIQANQLHKKYFAKPEKPETH